VKKDVKSKVARNYDGCDGTEANAWLIMIIQVNLCCLLTFH